MRNATGSTGTDGDGGTGVVWMMKMLMMSRTCRVALDMPLITVQPLSEHHMNMSPLATYVKKSDVSVSDGAVEDLEYLI